MNLPYEEGTWFAIPLRQGGYAAGIIARYVPNEGKIILAYFFGPKRKSVPTLDELETLTPDRAVKVARVGDLGIIEGSWPIMGRSSAWNREMWPIPKFIRRDEIGKCAWCVVYADDNPNHVVSEQRISYDTSEYEKDSLLGAGAAEVVLSKILS